jgi:hypothetical protein
VPARLPPTEAIDIFSPGYRGDIDTDVIEQGTPPRHGRHALLGAAGAVTLLALAVLAVLQDRSSRVPAPPPAMPSVAVPSGHPLLPADATRIQLCGPTQLIVAQTVRNVTGGPVRISAFQVARGTGVTQVEAGTEPGLPRYGCAGPRMVDVPTLLGPDEVGTGTARLEINCRAAAGAYHTEAHRAVGTGRVWFTVTVDGEDAALDVTPQYSQEWSWLVDVVRTACRL